MATKKNNLIVLQKSMGIGKKPRSVFEDRERYEANKAHYDADGYKAFYPEDKAETVKEPKETNKEPKKNKSEVVEEISETTEQVGEKANKEDIG